MKIGILTFHFGNNYGGILQCYALQQVLTSRGHEVEVINYRATPLPLYLRVYNKIKTISSYKTYLKLFREHFLTNGLPGKQKEEEVRAILAKFDAFRAKYLHITSPVNAHTIGNWCNKKYDAVVVGSDQVWTSLYEKEYVYFLNWQPEFPGKKISYAACSAHAHVHKKQEVMLAGLLRKF